MNNDTKLVTAESLQERFTITTVPEKLKKNKKGIEHPSYWVTVKNLRTGYTKLMPRAKAFRYINDRPALWTYVSPLFSFKDHYEVV
jgi:hypothetical protein